MSLSSKYRRLFIKKDLIILTLENLSVKINQRIDIICLTETFIKSGNEDNLNLLNLK